MPKLEPSKYAKKVARNKTASIYADLKWKCKIKDLSALTLIGLINEAKGKTLAQVKVAEIRDEAVKHYDSMISQVHLITSPNGLPEINLNAKRN
jgi:hypothetical protein